jgi:hypothetical protein
MNSPTIECITDRPTESRRFSACFHRNKGRHFISWILISTLSSSCCTTALWDATDPNECIEVSADAVTEEALIEDGFKFHQHTTNGLFHIEKTTKQKAGDYSLRVVGTPVAVGADVLLVGVFSLGLMYGMDPAEVDWNSFNM